MADFSEETSHAFLRQPWLVKIDESSRTAYLIKVCVSDTDSSCSMMVTDTKKVWCEVLDSKQFARRWRTCNDVDAELAAPSAEDEWRALRLQLLSRAFTLESVDALSFASVESKYADTAFEMRCDAFTWRWETNFVGYKMSAELLSTHLIMPLVNVNNFAFSSPEAVGEISSGDLEKAIDRGGRTARRLAERSTKNALSKPRVATTLARMTAISNAVSELPNVQLEVEKTEPQGLPLPSPAKVLNRAEPATLRSSPSREPSPIVVDFVEEVGTRPSPVPPDSPAHAVPTDSATEDSEIDGLPSAPVPSKGKSPALPPEAAPAKAHTPPPPRRKPAAAATSDSDSSPVSRPAVKRARPKADSSDDSDDERKPVKSGAGAKRGTRQPIKRGGKRF
ncbi:hypothetical protein PLICRDRAFT_174716 [Plicaturopsis crispa FD-325 SS-3]|nr:hypothetical protein PLICRDRAFT_174716 [Plicaturopsis crispa FD-325 SS-3]